MFWTPAHQTPARAADPGRRAWLRRLSAAALAPALLTLPLRHAAAAPAHRDTRVWTTPDEAAGQALVARLRQGGLVLYFRHTDTTGMPCDRSYRVGDRAGQRNLSPEGVAQAQRIGEALRALQIPWQRPVLAGPVYRARDTAEGAFGAAQVQITDDLIADDYAATNGLALADVLAAHGRLFTAPVPADTNRVLVGHRMPGIMVVGPAVGGPAFPEGSALVLQPGGPAPRLLGILQLVPLPGRGFHAC